MNTHPEQSPRDDEVDRLLARRYCETSPEFEARWVALKRELRQAPSRRRWALLSWSRWLAVGTLAAALVVAVATWRQPGAGRQSAPEVSPALAELFAMDAVLGRATVLLDPENREALLNLPVKPQPRT